MGMRNCFVFFNSDTTACILISTGNRRLDTVLNSCAPYGGAFSDTFLIGFLNFIVFFVTLIFKTLI